MKRYIRILLLFLLSTFLWNRGVLAQPDSTVIRASTMKSFLYMVDNWGLWIDHQKKPGFVSVPMKDFKFSQQHYLNRLIPSRQIVFPHYITFTINNNLPDTATYYFFPAPEDQINLREVTGDNSYKTILSETYRGDYIFEEPLYKLVLPPNTTHRYVFKVIFPQHAYASISAWLINAYQLEDFFYFYLGITYYRATFDFVFCGMLLMMIIYIVFKYVQLKSTEYLYYAFYMIFFLCYFILKTMDQFEYAPIKSSPFLFSYMGRVFQVAAYCMYFLFFRKFLETTDPRINGVVKWLIMGLISYLVADLYLVYIPSTVALQNILWSGIRIFLLAVVIYSIVVVGASKSKVGMYLVLGSSALGFFAFLSMLFSAYSDIIADFPYPLDMALSYFQIGIVMELLFFSLGLGYKNRLAEIEKTQAKETLKLEAVRLTFERYKAVTEVRETERGRIAKDLHDGIGGMLSGLKFSMAALRDNTPVAEDGELMIQRNIDMLDSAMQELRRVSHDMMPQTLVKFGLVKALQDYCDQIASMKTLRLTFQCFGSERRIDPTHEIIIYRIVQELLNNIMKHSGAQSALVQLVFQHQSLSLTVEDDGKGFDEAILEKSIGSGWPNIRSRVEYLKGSMDVKTAIGKGTSVVIEIALP